MEVSIHIAALLLILFNIINSVRTDNRPRPWTDLNALSWISDCDFSNRTKACFRHPPSCTKFPRTENDYTDEWCNVVVRWQQTFDAKSVNFEMYAPAWDISEYIAIAFSANQKMLGSDVLACLLIDGTPQVSHSYNTVSHVNEERDLVGVSRVSGSFANGIFNCNFTRTKHLPGQSFFHNLNDKFYLLASRGPNANGKISYHDEYRWSSTEKIDFSQYTGDPGPTTQSLTSDVAYRKTGHSGGFYGGPCSSNPCQNAGTCWDVTSGFVCECYDNYAGRRCEIDATGDAAVLSSSVLAVCSTLMVVEIVFRFL